jgi:poly(beta-D-mannuronate) lyase
MSQILLIALNEEFSYIIDANGNFLDVEILQGGNLVAETTIDMSASGYDVSDDFMYFKAGVYHVNNDADPEQAAQITFYQLENNHDGYAFNTSSCAATTP